MSLDEGCFQRCLVSDSVILKPHRIGRNVKEVILAKLCETFEGVCSRHGYILPASIRLHRASPGSLEGANLNGDVRYDLQYHAMVCNPAIGSVIAARVVNMTRFGFLLHSGAAPPKGGDAVAPLSSIVETIVSRQATYTDLANTRSQAQVHDHDHAHDSDDDDDGSEAGMDTVTDDLDESTGTRQVVDLDNIQIGDVVNIRVMGKKFQLNDRHISVVGRIVERAPNRPVGQVPVIGDNNEEDLLVIAAAEISADERDEEEGDGQQSDSDNDETGTEASTDDDGEDGEEGDDGSGSESGTSSVEFRIRKTNKARKTKASGDKEPSPGKGKGKGGKGTGKARKSDEGGDSDEGDDTDDDIDDDDEDDDGDDVDGEDGDADGDGDGDGDLDGDGDGDGDDDAKDVSDDDEDV